MPPQASGGGVELRVTKRLLWIGAAAYPLHNIARVYTTTLRPRRREAVLRFLKYAAVTLAVAVLLMLPGLLAKVSSQGTGSGADGYLTFVWLAAGLAGVYFFVEMLSVLTAAPVYVLAVETNGASTGVVTSQNQGQLDQLVGQITYAVEHPDIEFRVVVERLTVSPNNYYFGDNVNMYGGNGNVGIAA
ncbi:DUF6232 family protein [Streptomyces sp. NPDC007905]|uniref:DUF6232 family protein n=1 Tax=Streptomyces sp. NPDC007905 TaxID=3364788 RepID=UPI0036F00EC0